MNQEKIGKFIADKRKEKNITQKEFAQLLNVTDKTVSRWENGHYLPDVSLFKSVCEILDIEVIELLNGENNSQKTKKEVDEAIINIMALSNKDKKKKINRILNISGIIICLIIIISVIIFTFVKIRINKLENELELYQTSDNSLLYPYKFASIEKDDGWFCSFLIEYSDDKPFNYQYNCKNLKYQYLEGFDLSYKEDDMFYKYKEFGGVPNYYYNMDYRKDIININNYFRKMQFESKISITDLDELELNHIEKEEILNIYNQAIINDLVLEKGDYYNIVPNYINESNLYKSNNWDNKDINYRFNLGYSCVNGHIYSVNIELLIDNEYLSDIVKSGVASQSQNDVYIEIQKIKSDIIKNQSFKIDINNYKSSEILYPLRQNLETIEKDK